LILRILIEGTHQFTARTNPGSQRYNYQGDRSGGRFDLAKSKLAEYEAKRDFTKTTEPTGHFKVRASKRLRFVIQKHAAKRLHYDLRWSSAVSSSRGR